MTLSRLRYEPGLLADFYQQALENMGAICERPWFDRLQVVAEDRAARLWDPVGGLLETELSFIEPDAGGMRDAEREVFPGCPLTFRLAEALLPGPPELQRAILGGGPAKMPTPEVAEKLWRARWPEAGRWRLDSPFRPVHHFSLIALVRCEIQAIDQHWSLHRLAVTALGGEADESLAAHLDFAELACEGQDAIDWPQCAPTEVGGWLGAALTAELDEELASIRRRQEDYLRRELERIDVYFAGYERELAERGARSQIETTRMKTQERLAAARSEHGRRRADQVQRHEIRIRPCFDAFMLVAEPAWRAQVSSTYQGQAPSEEAIFVPRCRRWFRGV